MELSTRGRLQCVALLNLAYTVLQISGSLYFNSLGLLSDGFHNLSDVAAVCCALLSLAAKSWEPTPEHPFGFRRAELLGGFVNGVALFCMCFFVFLEAVARIVRPEATESGYGFILIASVGVLINLASAAILATANDPDAMPVCAHSHGHHGHDHGHRHGGAAAGPKVPYAPPAVRLSLPKLGRKKGGAYEKLPLTDEMEMARMCRTAADAAVADCQMDELKTDENDGTGDEDDDLSSLCGVCAEGDGADGEGAEGDGADGADGGAFGISPPFRHNYCGHSHHHCHEHGAPCGGGAAAEAPAEVASGAGGLSAARGNANVWAVVLHSLSDAVTSVVVAGEAVLLHATRRSAERSHPLWSFAALYLDPLLSIALAAAISLSVLPFVRRCALQLLDGAPEHLDVTEAMLAAERSHAAVVGVSFFSARADRLGPAGAGDATAVVRVRLDRRHAASRAAALDVAAAVRRALGDRGMGDVFVDMVF